MSPAARNPSRSKKTSAVIDLPTNGSSPHSSTTTYSLDRYRTEAHIAPFILETDTDRIEIPPPTGETLLTIGETPIVNTRTLFELLCGDEFNRVWDAVRHEPAGVLVGLLQDLGKHFMIMSVQEAPGGFDASPPS